MLCGCKAFPGPVLARFRQRNERAMLDRSRADRCLCGFERQLAVLFLQIPEYLRLSGMSAEVSDECRDWLFRGKVSPYHASHVSRNSRRHAVIRPISGSAGRD